MKLSIFLSFFFLVWYPVSYAAELDSAENRIIAFEDRTLAAQDYVLTREQLLNLCRGREGARWCEGYIAATLTALKIPKTGVCLPMTDMAPFLFGEVWELTKEWLYKQPEDVKIKLHDAITSALVEQEQCSF